MRERGGNGWKPGHPTICQFETAVNSDLAVTLSGLDRECINLFYQDKANRLRSIAWRRSVGRWVLCTDRAWSSISALDGSSLSALSPKERPNELWLYFQDRTRRLDEAWCVYRGSGFERRLGKHFHTALSAFAY